MTTPLHDCNCTTEKTSLLFQNGRTIHGNDIYTRYKYNEEGENLITPPRNSLKLEKREDISKHNQQHTSSASLHHLCTVWQSLVPLVQTTKFTRERLQAPLQKGLSELRLGSWKLSTSCKRKSPGFAFQESAQKCE